LIYFKSTKGNQSVLVVGAGPGGLASIIC